MNLIQHLFASSLGKKYLMAVSGLALLLFTVGHMIGNLQIFLGRETINTYAAFLQTNREILWTVRLGLLAMVILHIWAAASLTRDNRTARPLGYEGNPAPTAASYASRTMVVSGIIIAAFIIYHLLHYTAQLTPINFTGSDFHALREPLRDGTDRHDVFAMMILGFRQPLVSLFYLVGVGLLAFHLSHGISATCQSLGFKNHHSAPFIERASLIVAWILFLGYAAIPLAVLLGFGRASVN